MSAQHTAGWTRRRFLGGLTLAGTAGLLGLSPRPVGAEPPPETTRLRIAQSPGICFAPQYMAGDQLLQAEGFVDVQYVKRSPVAFPLLVSGELDLASTDVSTMIAGIDQGQPIVILAGLHGGCYELFGTDQIRSIHDLVGKKVTVPELHAGRHLMLSTMLAYVGIDPHRDITWITQAAPESMRLLAEGQIDAFLGFPPEPQELRARRIGHLLLSMTVDRPWSQ
jgi:NitT/TauT family transport system substrate-binding protein